MNINGIIIGAAVFLSIGICHLQRTGDTMAPSFLSWAKALSTLNYSIKSINASTCDFRRAVCSSVRIIRPSVQASLFN